MMQLENNIKYMYANGNNNESSELHMEEFLPNCVKNLIMI